MNLYKHYETQIRQAASQLGFAALDKIEATPPRDSAHGDVATNAAMVIAAQSGKNPREIAGLLLPHIQAFSGVLVVDIAGPGFINITLDPAVWQRAMLDILASGLGYGNSALGEGKNVNVEYVSANPTGPMHVGHGRGAVFGDALATLLMKAGYNVTKEYYINDAGAQVDKLAESAYLRYREACGEAIGDIPAGLYPGEYLIAVGEALRQLHGETLLASERDEWLPVVRDYALGAIMEMIKDDLSALGITHDVFTSEREMTLAGKVEEAVALLDRKGLIYTGVLEAPKGKAPDDWEPRPQTLFKSTQFGDDVDRAIKKSDGSWTYFAPDIAYHYDKCKRGFDLLIDVFGADHGGYVKRIKSAVHALSDGKVAVEVKLMQMIKLLRGGQPAKMSKRAGNFVTIREVVDEVGKDVLRFIMLTRKNDAPLDFDFAKVMEQSKDNPVFYVQYAHARTRSIMRNAASEVPEALPLARQADASLASRLSHPAELALIKLMCSWPRVVEQAAIACEPHRIAFYLQDLAAAFHGLWNQGNDDLSLRFLQKNDIEMTAAKLALVQAVSIVVASGLMVLGVEPAEEMR
ncbi:MAG: arginine--tRNA ligase [Alphaproteobacteria bacterium]|nr:arginine--tRNA ligase [Alphaproteobacteria bacterium]